MLERNIALAAALSLTAVLACGTSSSSDDDDDDAHGGAGTGAGHAGSSAGGDSARGGASAGGTSGTAGNSRGGTATNGGSTNGGSTNGGTGGASTSGNGGDAGAPDNAGASTGGAAMGGSSSGMTSVGGNSTGGSSSAGTGGCADIGPAAALLLVDVSLSMAMDVSGIDRWEYTRASLESLLDGLPDGFPVGLVFFPNVETDISEQCFVPDTAVQIWPLDATQRGFLKQALAAVEPRGGTPTHDAYAYALSALAGVGSGVHQHLVLVTDGEPTYALGCCAGAPPDCMGDGLPTQSPPTPTEPLIEAVRDAYADGVHTFVVGALGSEPARSFLSFMGRTGGTGPSGCDDAGPNFCHYDLTVSPIDALTATLAEIADNATESGCP